MPRMFRVIVAIMAVLAFWLAPGGAKAQNPEAQKWIKKGENQLMQQQSDQALASFKKALKYEPKSALIYNYLGMTYRYQYNQVRNQELKQQEIAAFKKALKIDPNYWVALINLGATYYYLGDKAKAASLFMKALRLNPNHPEKAQLEKMIKAGEKKP